ncbi:TlpA family protein disulfide reductase [Spirosoma agri]|uniref:TlpA family protein disulfide reductase n=1 Tax=Spirosoma agri TaxID=1987381 RepID=UPI0013DCFA01|nr:TlpA disulfide reductase family protein [Spirosoma agri]
MPYLGDFRREDSLPIGTNDKYIHYEIASPQNGYLALDHLGATIYLVPSDTLVLTIDLSQDNPWQKYQFKGTYARINQYYFDQARALKSLPMHTRAQLANQMPTLAIYQQKMDSLLKVELAYFESYLTKHSLPLWFVQKEKQQIRYSDAAYRTNAVTYRRFIKMDSANAVPKNYYHFVSPSLLNDPSAAHLVDYQHFLTDYFFHLYFQQKRVKEAANYLPILASTYVSGLSWDIFMARLLSEYLAGLPTSGEQMLAKYYPKFTDKRWINQLRDYYRDAYTLKPGELAPNFALEDHLDSLAYLKDFRGQVIYLSFWFTGCAPCRQEMPLENELVKYFEGKPVRIVNICVRSSQADWAKVSKLYNLQTVNLYANKAWESTLISKYNVKAYPHYVLIDQEGKIVKNNCSRPSGNAKAEIAALLKQ